MEHTFVNAGKGWQLRLADEEHLQDYLDTIWSKRLAMVRADQKALQQIQLSDEFSKCEKDMVLTHVTNPLTTNLMCLGWRSAAFIYNTEKMSNSLLNGMFRVLHEQGCVYVNPIGGYCSRPVGPFCDEDRPLEVYRKEGPDFPAFEEDDIEIKQWEGGRHYYAYIGDMPCIDDGKQRFETEEEAKRAARRTIYKFHEGRRYEHFTGDEHEWRSCVLEKLPDIQKQEKEALEARNEEMS